MISRKIKRLVLGGGFAGCAVSHIAKAPLLAPDIGGATATKNFFPVMLYNDEEKIVQKFLESLDLCLEFDVCQYAYHYLGSLYTFLPSNMAVKYYLRSRRTSFGVQFFPDSFAESFPYIKVNNSEFFWSFLKHITPCPGFIQGEAVAIDLKNRVVEASTCEDQHTFIEYEQLVSTVPAFKFFDLIGEPMDFKYSGKRFVAKKKPPIDMLSFTYIYFPEGLPRDKNLLRVTKCDKKFIYEYPQSPLLRGSSSMFYAYIIAPDSIPKFPDVKFFGRYAEWNDKISLRDVIIRIYKELL